MKRFALCLAVLTSSSLLLAGASGAAPVADGQEVTTQVCADGSTDLECETFTTPVDPDTGGFGFSIFNQDIGLGPEGSEQATLTSLSMSGNVDPVQNSAGSLADDAAPSTFTVMSSMAITPITGLATFSLSLDLDCSDGGANNGCTIGFGTFPDALVVYTVNGSTEVARLGTSGSSGSAQQLSLEFEDSGVFDCGAGPGCTSMETEISWTGSGGGDVYTWNSRFELNVIPEPGTGVLFAAGALLLGAALRRDARESTPRR